MIDLKQLMEERSADPPAVVDLRYPQIRQRIALRHRRQVALLATAIAVVVAVAGGYVGIPRHRVSPGPAGTPAPFSPPAVTPRPTAPPGFVSYEFGRKLIHYATAPLSDRRITITWTPTSHESQIHTYCPSVPQRVQLFGSLQVNGHEAEPVQCGPIRGGGQARTEDWTRSGFIRPGEPVTLTFTIDRGVKAEGNYESAAPVPTDGIIALAIYAPVPFEQYPLPPAPATLPPLAGWKDCPLDHFITSDRADPLRPISVTTQWRGQLVFRWDTQTPGLLELAVDGVTFATVGWWDYGGLNWSRLWDTTHEPEWAGIPGWKFPAQGQEVTFTFTPRYFTGAWQAGLRHLEDEFADYGPCR